MRQDDFPHPVSDLAASGIPEYADDDSTADEQMDTGTSSGGASAEEAALHEVTDEDLPD